MKKMQCKECNSSVIKKVGDLVYECQNCGKQYSQEELQNIYFSMNEEETSKRAKKEKKDIGIHFSKYHIAEEKTENIFVIASMVFVIVLAFIFFGWSGISSFLSSPLIWKGEDSLEIRYMGTIEDKRSDEYDINVAVVNNTKEAIDDYTFILNIAGEEIEVDDYSVETDNAYNKEISAFSVTRLQIPVYAEDFGGSLRSTKISKEALEELLANQKLDSLEVSWRIIELSSDGEELVKNTGTVKNIVIIALSFVFGILGFFGGIRITALRVIFKLLGIFAVIFVVLLIVFFAVIRYTTSAEGQAAQEKLRQEQDKMKRQKAAIEYKNAAQAKANATNARTAAYAQERMDKSMADMISGNPAATNAYKSAAHTKSVATASGNHKLAAQAQAQMDKNMADILKDK